MAILKEKNVDQTAKICWADEMRLGLISQVRRVWSSVGIKVVQKIQISYKYVYLHLAVDGIAGTFHWRWAENMKTESVIKAVELWENAGIDAIIWDGASSHRAKDVQALDLTLICQPPYAPELNPAERVFEAVRQEVEGCVYDTLEMKQEVVDQFLKKLVSEPEKIKSLTGWGWIQREIAKLPLPAT